MLLLLAGCETMQTVGQTMETAIMSLAPQSVTPRATAPTEATAAAPPTQEAASAATPETAPVATEEAAPAPKRQAAQAPPQTAAPPAPAAPSAYAALLEQAKRGDPALDFAALRYAYAETPSYVPYGGPLAPVRRAMFANFKVQDCDEAVADADRILAIEYVNIDAHFVQEQCARHRGDLKRATEARLMVNGLIRSILNSGNGHKPESAFIVISVAEEYSLTGLLGYSVGKQSLEHAGQSSFDRLELKRPEGDGTDIVFFNIDRPLAWLAKHPSAQSAWQLNPDSNR
jgi:hypothetical protein